MALGFRCRLRWISWNRVGVEAGGRVGPVEPRLCFGAVPAPSEWGLLLIDGGGKERERLTFLNHFLGDSPGCS